MRACSRWSWATVTCRRGRFASGSLCASSACRSRRLRLRLDTPAFHERILQYSPARRVPVLLDGELAIWETLAIGEYLDELTDGAAWPRDRAARARARSLAAEMHSGFAALREAWSFRAAATGLAAPLSANALQDLARIDAIWSGCRAQAPRHRTLALRHLQLRRRHVRAGRTALPHLRRDALLGRAWLLRERRRRSARGELDPRCGAGNRGGVGRLTRGQVWRHAAS